MPALEFAELRGVEIFAAGTWRGNKTVTVTESDLDEMVNSFNALNARVKGLLPPLKLGHTEAQKFMNQGGSGAPALGWVDRIWREGKKILADFSSVPASLLDMVKARLYNSVSIEFMPTYSFEGKTYKNVLAAVALLGAELPAVKGLKDLAASLFDDNTERVTLTEKDEGIMATGDAKFTQEQVDDLIAAAVARSAVTFKAEHDGALVTATQATATEAAKAKAEGERADRAEAALNTFRADASKAAIVTAVDAAIKEGKLLPKEKDATVAFAQSLDTSKKIKFGAEEKTPLDQFLATLSSRPAVVKFGERLQGKGEGDQGEGRADQELDAKAKAKVSADASGKLTYSDAVQVVLAEDPALKERYFRGE